jgi:hypothetical protein
MSEVSVFTLMQLWSSTDDILVLNVIGDINLFTKQCRVLIRFLK